jgi:hypothetical protein
MTPMLGIMASQISGKLGPPITANMTGRWDPSVASSVTLSSGRVSQLNDLSGNGRHMVQATSSNQPTYTTAGKNGLNTMTFGGDDYLTPASTWSQTYMTFFIVVRFSQPGSTTTTIATGWSNYQLDLQNNTPSSNSNFEWQLEPGGMTSFHWADGASNANWHYFSIKRPNSGTTPTAKIDGGGTWAKDGAPVGPITTLSTGKLWLGTRNDIVIPLQGDMGEVISYSDLMSDTDIATTNAYLAAKWGI